MGDLTELVAEVEGAVPKAEVEPEAEVGDAADDDVGEVNYEALDAEVIRAALSADHAVLCRPCLLHA